MALKNKTKKISRSQLPSKRTINLVEVNRKKTNYKVLVPVAVIVALAIGAFTKFAVIDKLAELSYEQSKLATTQMQIDAAKAKIESYGGLAEEYAHYTYSGMTEEELNRADRIRIIDMIQRVISPELTVDSWSVSGNELQLTVAGASLQQVNLIAEKLQEEESLVKYCMVTTASTNDASKALSGGKVTAKLSVYLYGPVEEAKNQ